MASMLPDVTGRVELASGHHLLAKPQQTRPVDGSGHPTSALFERRITAKVTRWLWLQRDGALHNDRREVHPYVVGDRPHPSISGTGAFLVRPVRLGEAEVDVDMLDVVFFWRPYEGAECRLLSGTLRTAWPWRALNEGVPPG